MTFDYAALGKETPEHPKSIYFKNTLRHVGSALLGQTSFEKTWNNFVDVNNLQADFDTLKKNWTIPKSLAPLVNDKKIDRPRTSLLLKLSPTTIFGVFRYGKLQKFTKNSKQDMTFHQVSILQINLSRQHNFLVDDPVNHAARYVRKAWTHTKIPYKGRTIYGFSDQTIAWSAIDLIEQMGLRVDIECHEQTLWIMWGGDRRDEAQFRALLGVSTKLTELLNGASSSVPSTDSSEEYQELPYGKVGLAFRITDSGSILSFGLLIVFLIFTAIAYFRYF